MLFQGARAALALARRAIQNRDRAHAGECLSKAMAIIDDGLNASLDMAKGGQLAERLRTLYNYMIGRLGEARRAQDAAPIGEVEKLLADLEESWRQIAKPPAAGTATTPAPGRGGSVSYGKA
jgi:flagellar protein FliS